MVNTRIKSKYGTHVIPQGKVLLLREFNIF